MRPRRRRIFPLRRYARRFGMHVLVTIELGLGILVLIWRIR